MAIVFRDDVDLFARLDDVSSLARYLADLPGEPVDWSVEVTDSGVLFFWRLDRSSPDQMPWLRGYFDIATGEREASDDPPSSQVLAFRDVLERHTSGPVHVPVLSAAPQPVLTGAPGQKS